MPPYPVFFGRRDGFPTTGFASVDLADLRLPSPNFTYAQLKENFANVTLNERDLVALSGSSLQLHCLRFIVYSYCAFISTVIFFWFTLNFEFVMGYGCLKKSKMVCL